MLTGDRLVKNLNSMRILDNVSVCLGEGEVLAIIGPSGAGKSTLLRALSLLDPPTRGTVVVDDTEYTFGHGNERVEPKPWPLVTSVFQQLFLWPHLTLWQNIELPLRLTGRMDSRAFARRLVEELDIAEMTSRFPYEASIGQRQRAAIVRAIALMPKYLLLDEVTSALDVEQVARLIQLLNRLRNEGLGIMVVTHLLGMARRVADRFVFIEQGRIAESGPVEDLFNTGSARLHAFLKLA